MCHNKKSTCLSVIYLADKQVLFDKFNRFFYLFLFGAFFSYAQNTVTENGSNGILPLLLSPEVLPAAALPILIKALRLAVLHFLK